MKSSVSNFYTGWRGWSILRKKFLIFVVTLVIILALAFEFYPCKSQVIDLSTGSGLSKMLRYDDAQVYIFGEAHRKVEYQKFRNVLFEYLVKEKVYVFSWRNPDTLPLFFVMKPCRESSSFPTGLIGVWYPKQTMSYSNG